ncbi:MAG: RHS repeat protein, partial [bacterium]|nr:RHS repeat protein [bacterium]
DRRTWHSRPGGITETFVWDGNSQLVSYADAEGHTTSWEYDAVARLERLTLPGVPEGVVYQYVYDKAHNLDKIIDPNGSVVDHVYDAANRLSTRTVTPGPNVEGVTAESFTYDGLNRLKSLWSDGVTTSLEWDSLSRLLSEETAGQAVGYDYDDAGNLRDLTYPSGLVVVWGHDNLNRPTEIGPWVMGGGEEPEIDAQVAYGYRGPSLVQQKILGNGLS